MHTTLNDTAIDIDIDSTIIQKSLSSLPVKETLDNALLPAWSLGEKSSQALAGRILNDFEDKSPSSGGMQSKLAVALHLCGDASDNVEVKSEENGVVVFELQPRSSEEAKAMQTSFTKNVGSNSEIELALMMALLPPDVQIAKLPTCYDTVCSPGEMESTFMHDTNITCVDDCFYRAAYCSVPGSLEMGDKTMVCLSP